MLRAASLIGLILLWQILIGTFQLVNPVVLPPPIQIFETALELLRDKGFLTHVWVTFRRTLITSAVASVVGVLIGLAMGWSDTVKAITFPIVNFTYPLPKIALFPLFLLIFGRGEQAFLITIALAATYLVMFNAMRGVDDIGNLYFEAAKDYGVDSTYRFFKEILIPGSLPMIFTGLRLTLNTALLVTVSLEFIAARQGLGAIIWTSWGTLQTGRMYVAILVVMVAGVFITYGLERIGTYAMPWKQATQDSS